MKKIIILHSLIASLIHWSCISAERNDLNNIKKDLDNLIIQSNENPTSYDLIHKIAVGYWWHLHDFENAEIYYKKALILNPQNKSALFDLAQVLNSKGKYQESATHFSKFINLDSLTPERKYAEKVLKEITDLIPKNRVEVKWQINSDSVTNSIGMKFKKIPGGKFTMGSKAGSTFREVELSPYWIGTYEVTAGQFEQFLKETGYQVRFKPINKYSRTKDHPISFVHWSAAKAFTIWLSYKENRVYRLPSEAEWEYAARGTDSRENPWGNEASKPNVHANIGRRKNALELGEAPTLEKVGQFKKGVSFFGLHDMGGNVAEWCLDYFSYDFHKYSPLKNPIGPTDTQEPVKKVQRGGSWRDSEHTKFALERYGSNINLNYDQFGFRVVCETD